MAVTACDLRQATRELFEIVEEKWDARAMMRRSKNNEAQRQ